MRSKNFRYKPTKPFEVRATVGHILNAIAANGSRNQNRNRAALRAIQQSRGLSAGDPMPAEFGLVGKDWESARSNLLSEIVSYRDERRRKRTIKSTVEQKKYALDDIRYHIALHDAVGQVESFHNMAELLTYCVDKSGLRPYAFAEKYSPGRKSRILLVMYSQQGATWRFLDMWHRIADDHSIPRATVERFIKARKRKFKGTGRKRPDTYNLASHGYALPWVEDGTMVKAVATRFKVKEHQGDKVLIEGDQLIVVKKGEFVERIRIQRLSGQFVRDLEDLEAHMTAPAPELKRREPWLESSNGRNGTLDAVRQIINRYLGWLYSEKGIPPESFTLVMLADSLLAEEFGVWLEKRNGAKTGCHRVVALGKALLNRTTGYITQQSRIFHKELGHLGVPSVADLYRKKCQIRVAEVGPSEILAAVYERFHDTEEVPAHLSGQDLFRTWCAESHARFVGLMKSVRSEQKERSQTMTGPAKRLEPILAKQHPMDVLIDIIVQMKSERTTRYAVEDFDRLRHECDIALVGTWTGIPLRVENVVNLRLPPEFLVWQNPDAPEERRDRRMRGYYDYEPNLIWYPDATLTLGGRWGVRIPRGEFKNRRFLPANHVYEVDFPDWIQPIVDEYIRKWWRRTPSALAGSKYLFGPCKSGAKPGDLYRLLKKLDPNSMSSRMRSVTMRYLHIEFGGTTQEESCHWIRHVVATDFIKNNPESFRAAAAILNDHLDTVIETYGHLLPKDDFGIHARYTSQQFKRRASELEHREGVGLAASELVGKMTGSNEISFGRAASIRELQEALVGRTLALEENAGVIARQKSEIAELKARLAQSS